MILYVFISCNNRINSCYQRIKIMMSKINYKHFIIVKGGTYNIYDKNKKILNLNCNDNYEGLSEKVINTYNFIYKNKQFNKYKYICKLDDDIIIKKLLDINILSDYCGIICYSNGNRKWHVGKCSKLCNFNNTEYKGEYVPWCLGGRGYILSKTILEFLINNKDYASEIYEDLYIAKLLNKNLIYPKNISNLSDYIYSEDHH